MQNHFIIKKPVRQPLILKQKSHYIGFFPSQLQWTKGDYTHANKYYKALLRDLTLHSIKKNHLFLVRGNDANVRDIHWVVELFGQLAAVEHDLYSFR